VTAETFIRSQDPIDEQENEEEDSDDVLSDADFVADTAEDGSGIHLGSPDNQLPSVEELVAAENANHTFSSRHLKRKTTELTRVLTLARQGWADIRQIIHHKISGLQKIKHQSELFNLLTPTQQSVSLLFTFW
jgi:hypothetical protein